MPKIVDHEQRRCEIVTAVWTLVARQGFGSLTMRDIASELGVANGALARYFPNRAAILLAALELANAATNARAAKQVGTRSGLYALRRLCLEIMPLDEVRLTEARVVIGFWGYAAPDPNLVDLFDQAMGRWREQMAIYLDQAIAAGDAPQDLPVRAVIDTLMAGLMGLQINAVFSPKKTTPKRQRAILERLLDGVIEPDQHGRRDSVRSRVHR